MKNRDKNNNLKFTTKEQRAKSKLTEDSFRPIHDIRHLEIKMIHVTERIRNPSTPSGELDEIDEYLSMVRVLLDKAYKWARKAFYEGHPTARYIVIKDRYDVIARLAGMAMNELEDRKSFMRHLKRKKGN